MNATRLHRQFFDRPTLTVAKQLLGKFLVHKIPSTSFPRSKLGAKAGQAAKTIVGMITEVEAYIGTKDLASHASHGRTPRTEVMFGPPGHAYVYLIYGMYFCLNFVTERQDYPAAVLIRAINIAGVNGPGKVCRYFQIDKTLNGEDVTNSRKLWLEDRGVTITNKQIKRSSRIGIDYAGHYKDKLWRFCVKIE